MGYGARTHEHSLSALETWSHLETRSEDPRRQTTRRLSSEGRERRRGRVGADAQGETREGREQDFAVISRRMYRRD